MFLPATRERAYKNRFPPRSFTSMLPSKGMRARRAFKSARCSKRIRFSSIGLMSTFLGVRFWKILAGLYPNEWQQNTYWGTFLININEFVPQWRSNCAPCAQNRRLFWDFTRDEVLRGGFRTAKPRTSAYSDHLGCNRPPSGLPTRPCAQNRRLFWAPSQ